MLKIISHDGPSRQGQWREYKTPHIIDYNIVDIVKNIATPFKIQKEIAQENMEQTIELAKKKKIKIKLQLYKEHNILILE